MLSIIIPTLNEEKYIPILLDSIKKQSLEDYEIIVADNNSTDKTVQIARNYGCKITKGGNLPAIGRNLGTKIAQGDLLLFLDADMALKEGSLKKFLEEFQKRKLNIASCTIEPPDNSKLQNFLYNFFYNYPVLFLEKILPHAPGFALVEKNIYRKIDGFNENVKFLEDALFVRECSKIGKFGILKSNKIVYSQRRFLKDGWVITYLKYFLADIYLTLLGPVKTNLFKYKFGHYKDNKD